MSDAKISCPSCTGNITFPKDLAGQAISCPHCGESIFLPKQNSKLVWLLGSALVVNIAVIGCILALQGRSKHDDKTTAIEARESHGTTAVNASQPVEIRPGTANKSEDESQFEKLVKEYYRCVTESDIKGLRSILEESCRTALTDDDLSKGFQKGSTFTFLGIESVSYRQSAAGKCALAKVRRIANTGFGNQEAVRDFKFVKEEGGWKVFRELDLADKVVAQFLNLGFASQVRTNIQLLRNGDPFDNWDTNDTNAFVAVFKLAEERMAVFPWQLDFTVTSNRVDGRLLHLGFSVRNSSTISWESPFLEFQLKRGGKVVLDGNERLPDVRPGQVVEKETSMFLSETLQADAKYDLDVFYSLGSGSYRLVRDLPLEFKVTKPTDLVKLEVIKTSFDLVKSEDDSSMWTARIDYRIKNVSKESIKDVAVKCVWCLQSGEVLDQSADYAIGIGDVPLSPGQLKAGFIRCGKGFTRAKVPITLDVYLETGDQRAQVVKGMLIK